ncbi:hypothetical protein RHGRI_010524 [Rhododendron griersonianum]|uniref:Mitochondrial carrier protein n=1 Tax=Rhododendron griersonianum TaxID=479676 RepID=A0AAV6KJI3_9ERIC|nr:hypothetical protein RHGRI_010524 [Rhododendron griersonianum]
MAEQNPKSKSIPPHVKAIAGSIGGMVEACCLQPIDVIKTRLQLNRSGSYRGIIHCGATIVRTEGVWALWEGLTPLATHLTLKYALRMGSNAVLQAAFSDPRMGGAQPRCEGSRWVVKIRQQQQRGLTRELLKYKGPVDCAHTIICEEGLLGLWVGAAPTVMRNGINQAAMFIAKNAFDRVLWDKQEAMEKSSNRGNR